MKYLLLACVFSLSSCAGFLDVIGGDPLEDVKLPRTDADTVAKALIAANETPDLDLDGNINGWAEWYAWMRALVQAYQALDAEKEETPEVPK